VGLARALYFDPEMLILDEGTSALDNETEAKFMRAVESLQGEITMISIAHRLTTVRGCNVICVLVNGKISEAGTYDELMESKSEFSVWQALLCDSENRVRPAGFSDASLPSFRLPAFFNRGRIWK
jgi:ABC-type multidrug transport system fused ATPase/permease subunit